MKKLLLSGVAVFLLAGLMSGPATAQFQYDTQVGLYTTPDGLGATGTSVMGQAVDVSLVLTHPRDPANGYQPFTQCQGFELSIQFSPMPLNNLFLLQTTLPAGSVDIGLNKDINQGYLDFVVGTSSGFPNVVVNDAVQLIHFVFLNVYAGMTEVTLTPYVEVNSIPGEMAFLGNTSDDLWPMYSKGGSHEAPVFIFNGIAVPVENESFGSVKALYR